MNFDKQKNLHESGLNCVVTGLNSVDSMLLQMMISVIFGDISRYRNESVLGAIKIREEYVGKTPNTPSLTPVEKDIISHIAG